MEDTEKSQLEEMLTCTVCRDIFKDPRQLPCGHSMCMHCLENMRDHSSDLPFRCPDCRSFFGQIIKVQKSYNLANIAENFRETRRRKVSLPFSVFLHLKTYIQMCLNIYLNIKCFQPGGAEQKCVL